MSNMPDFLFYAEVGVIGYFVIRILVEIFVFRRCKQCGHANVLHKSIKFEKFKAVGCRITDCECYKEERTPDFLRDCYGMDEHDQENIGGHPSAN